MEKAKVEYTWKRAFRVVVLNIQKCWIIPGAFRYRLLRLGGVKCDRSFIGSDVGIDTTRPNLLSIGHGCVITSGVKILTHFHNPVKHAMFWGEVNIGNNVFIGMNVCIVNSVSIGDGAVVAAGAIVNKDIPAGELWGGVPAKFIKKI